MESDKQEDDNVGMPNREGPRCTRTLERPLPHLDVVEAVALNFEIMYLTYLHR